MKELEAEAILFAGSLDHLAGREHHRAHPMVALRLLTFVNEQQTRLQHTPELSPGLQSSPNLRNK